MDKVLATNCIPASFAFPQMICDLNKFFSFSILRQYAYFRFHGKVINWRLTAESKVEGNIQLKPAEKERRSEKSELWLNERC